jgi:hypothetical protein
MPTTKRRHAVTETGAVAEALAELRAEPGGADVPISELVVIGARALAAEKRARRHANALLLAEVADMVREGGPPFVDPEAADEVRRSGWVRPT